MNCFHVDVEIITTNNKSYCIISHIFIIFA